ncbi:MAG: VacJ family lipoprotein [Gammaproteobacteria bacterium]|nr:VacJ family lipoprotein [Gammaproteobacteria bacterium]
MKIFKFIIFLLFFNLASCANVQENSRVYDPFEPSNRAIFEFNDKFDSYIMQPIARTYIKLPELMRQGINNFFSNLGDFVSLINDILQLKPERASNDVIRIALNSTFGICGIFDIATALNINKNNESFADTLGYWGVGSGAYLVIPFLGPSNFRDAPAMFFDSYINPVNELENVRVRNSLQATSLINMRANLLKVSNLSDDVSFDPYIFQRDLYYQYRQNRIYDGDPPMESFDELNFDEIKE